MQSIIISLVIAFFVSFTILILVPSPPPSADALFLSPSFHHLLGTDEIGRDIFLVTLRATSYSLIDGLLLGLLIAVLGIPLGIISGCYSDRRVDLFLRSLAEGIASFPGLVLILFTSLLGIPLAVVLPIFYWIPIWRVVRAQITFEINQPYFESALALGHSFFSAVLHHSLPNALPTIIGGIGVTIAEVIGIQAAIEILGIGVNLSSPTLGVIIGKVFQVGTVHYLTWLPATISLVTLVIVIDTIAKRNISREK